MRKYWRQPGVGVGQGQEVPEGLDEIDEDGYLAEIAAMYEAVDAEAANFVKPRELWQQIPDDEKASILSSDDLTVKSWMFEIQLVNNAGELLDRRHPRFAPGLAALENAGVITPATVNTLRGNG